jgi:hypothetical protein
MTKFNEAEKVAKTTFLTCYNNELGYVSTLVKHVEKVIQVL